MRTATGKTIIAVMLKANGTVFVYDDANGAFMHDDCSIEEADLTEAFPRPRQFRALTDFEVGLPQNESDLPACAENAHLQWNYGYSEPWRKYIEERAEVEGVQLLPLTNSSGPNTSVGGGGPNVSIGELKAAISAAAATPTVLTSAALSSISQVPFVSSSSLFGVSPKFELLRSAMSLQPTAIAAPTSLTVSAAAPSCSSTVVTSVPTSGAIASTNPSLTVSSQAQVPSSSASQSVFAGTSSSTAVTAALSSTLVPAATLVDANAAIVQPSCVTTTAVDLPVVTTQATSAMDTSTPSTPSDKSLRIATGSPARSDTASGAVPKTPPRPTVVASMSRSPLKNISSPAKNSPRPLKNISSPKSGRTSPARGAARNLASPAKSVQGVSRAVHTRQLSDRTEDPASRTQPENNDAEESNVTAVTKNNQQRSQGSQSATIPQDESTDIEMIGDREN